MGTPKIWELWYADFKFEESDESKDRPVLVIDIQGGTIFVSAMITSHNQRDEWGDVDIADYVSAGLPGPSTIRSGRVLALSLSKFRRRIGKLTDRDKAEFEKKNY